MINVDVFTLTVRTTSSMCRWENIQICHAPRSLCVVLISIKPSHLLVRFLSLRSVMLWTKSWELHSVCQRLSWCRWERVQWQVSRIPTGRSLIRSSSTKSFWVLCCFCSFLIAWLLWQWWGSDLSLLTTTGFAWLDARSLLRDCDTIVVYSMLSFTKRICRDFGIVDVLESIYFAHVRSHLNYTSVDLIIRQVHIIQGSSVLAAILWHTSSHIQRTTRYQRHLSNSTQKSIGFKTVTSFQ